MPTPADEIAPPALIPLEYLDDHLLVVDKPAGLLAVPGRGADKADCLAARVQAQVADALVVHRLDQATSGLMLFARGLAMQRALSAAFENRKVAKHYIAIVHGVPDAAEGEIDLPLAADWPNRPRQCVDAARGKPALTRWRVLEAAPDGRSARLQLSPVTGRSHQLRVHLAAIGHAIVGDALYAPPHLAGAAPRLMLHAQALAFAHPASGSDVGFDSPPPF